MPIFKPNHIKAPTMSNTITATTVVDHALEDLGVCGGESVGELVFALELFKVPLLLMELLL